MSAEIDRERVRELTAQGGHLVEVLPPEDYEWAHLPGAVNIPLKELRRRSGELDPGRPVVVYCHDALCDMSPRAAAWLSGHGFGEVYDYMAGKMDWLAAGLPYEGTAKLVAALMRRKPATAAPQDTVETALARRAEAGFGPVVVVDDAGVVVGAAYREDLTSARPADSVEAVARLGVSTVRPSEQVDPLLDRMGGAGVRRIVVTHPDGTLAGLFVPADVT